MTKQMQKMRKQAERWPCFGWPSSSASPQERGQQGSHHPGTKGLKLGHPKTGSSVWTAWNHSLVMWCRSIPLPAPEMSVGLRSCCNTGGERTESLLLVARPGALVASLLLVARPGALVASLLLVARPGALVASLLLVVRPGALVASLFLVVRPGAPSSVLAPSSKARSP